MGGIRVDNGRRLDRKKQAKPKVGGSNFVLEGKCRAESRITGLTCRHFAALPILGIGVVLGMVVGRQLELRL